MMDLNKSIIKLRNRFLYMNKKLIHIGILNKTLNSNMLY
jgi:hypothetical protein